MDHRVVAFYKYIPIIEADVYAIRHLKYCKRLGIGGRIIVADEGINGQLTGTVEQINQYIKDLTADERFADVLFKIDEIDKPAFHKIHVRYKPEIVHSGLSEADSVNPFIKTAPHLKAADFKKLKDQKDVLILDVRSEYEYRIGRFKNAMTLPIENFREFPEQLEKLEAFKDKTVITYCTGGIKCEKASAYLLAKGFKDVYQLEGGIVQYGKDGGGEDFEGKLYVFDGRVVADVNMVNPTLISYCIYCKTPSARMVNCCNELCNEQVVMCESCGWEWKGACKESCLEVANKRSYDGSGYYPKGEHALESD